ncbi:MAG: DNA polymerase III subunit, partial [Butyrivibrio sp.]|nr:DNA polymerase III subunit [Butyrivibrio sp.]
MPTFKDIIGQVHIKRHMQRAVAENRVSHAWLLAGEAQMGKELLARTFTQALLCENLREKRKRGELQNPLAAEPCCACASCRKVMSDAHPDVRVVTHEKPTSVRVEEIEDQLVDDAYLTAYASDRKIYIVPDAQMMTAEAQNKLLKTLEEPPSYVTILLLSTGLQALLPTIRSRCLPFTLRPVEHDTLVRFLREKAGASEYRANLAAGFARGNPGLALSLARDARFETRTRGAIQLMEHLQDTGLHEIEER